MHRDRLTILALLALAALLLLAARPTDRRQAVGGQPAAVGSAAATVETSAGEGATASALDPAALASATWADELARLAAQFPAPVTRVRGRVVDRAGRPIPDARVSSSNHAEATVVAGPDGGYALDVNPAVFQCLGATAPGLATLRPAEFGFRGCGSMLGMMKPEWPAEAQADDIVLAPTGALQGQVVDDRGQPVADACVRLAGSTGALGHAHTDDGGAFLVEGLSEDAYRVTVLDSDGTYCAVLAGQRTELRLVAPRHVRLHVQLTLLGGELAKVLAALPREARTELHYQRAGVGGFRTGPSLDSPEVTIDDRLEAGVDYDLVARLPGWSGTVRVGAASPGEERTVRLELRPAPRVELLIHDAAGRPVVAARIMARGRDDLHQEASAPTDANGRVVLDDLFAGPHDLFLGNNDWDEDDHDGALLGEGLLFADGAHLELVAPPQRTLEVDLVDGPTGGPLVGSQVQTSTCTDPDEYEFERHYVAATGPFHLELRTRFVWLAVEAPGRRLVRRLAVGDDAGPLRVEVPRAGDLVVRLRTPDGVEVGPFAGVELALRRLDGPNPFYVLGGPIREQPDGSFLASELVAGRFQVTASTGSLALLARRAGVAGLRLSPLEVTVGEGERAERVTTLEVEGR